MLTDLWRDIISIVGFLATVLGLVYAIVQIWKTTSAAEAAERAAKEALNESKANFRKYTALFAHRFVNEVRTHVENQDWGKAAMRARDLADQMAQIANQSVGELRKLADTFGTLATGEPQKMSKKKWTTLLTEVETQIDAFIRPFEQKSQEEPHDSQ